jgi:hypothetical protein
MALRDKNTLRGWFLRGMKPLESQFADWIDSYWHKSEKISMTAIIDLVLTIRAFRPQGIQNSKFKSLLGLLGLLGNLR